MDYDETDNNNGLSEEGDDIMHVEDQIDAEDMKSKSKDRDDNNEGVAPLVLALALALRLILILILLLLLILTTSSMTKMITTRPIIGSIINAELTETNRFRRNANVS